MTTAHPHRAVIPPVAGSDLARWSVMIPTRDCAVYLRRTLSSVLAQDPGRNEMQIEVVDDHSTKDDPAAVVEELGNGRVGFFRQPRPVGRDQNFETCLRRSRGNLVHLLHGDDWVMPGFYERLGEGLNAAPQAGAAFCRHIYTDAEGHWQSISPLERSTPGLLDGWLESIARGQRIATPSVVVRRSTYERLGGFDRRLRTSEDWEMWVRIAAHFPVWFEPEPLAAYRMHRPGALTEAASREATLVRDMRRAVDVIAEWLPMNLPPAEVRRLLAQARSTYARWGLDGASTAAHAGSVRRTWACAREALECSRSPRVLGAVAAVLSRASLNRARHLGRSSLARLYRAADA